MSTVSRGSGHTAQPDPTQKKRRLSRSQLEAKALRLYQGGSVVSADSGASSTGKQGRRRRRKRRSAAASVASSAGGEPQRLTAQQRGRRTYKFPRSEDKKNLRLELSTVAEGWGFYDLIHFKKEWARIGMWTWESDMDTQLKAREAAKLKELEDTQISRAKSRFQRLQERQVQIKEMRCQWKGFDHKGRRAVCLNNRIIHARTKQLTQYCGFHVDVCVHKWPTSNACVPYLEEHRNGWGMCVNHYKAKFTAAEPPELDKIPGVVSKKQFEAKWSKRLAKAMRMPHPLAPDPVSSDESDYSTSSDDSEDERELARKRREEAKARLKAAKKRMLEEQGLEPDSDDDEEGRSLEQIWYTKVKQPILQRIYGRRKATLIQSWYRGLKAQWHLRTLRRVVQRQGRDAAVRVIQNCWQGHLDRVYVRQRRIRMHRAARSIQKGWHFYQFWQVIREKLAAIKIAQWFHQLRINNFLRMLGVIAKSRLHRKRKMEAWQATLEGMKHESCRICGVIGLQRLWRGFTARRYHQLLVRVHRTASNAIGGWYLGSLARTVARNNLRRAVHCATKIQACIRCFLAQQYVKRLRVEYRIAATKLQSWWRGEVDRELVRTMLVRLEKNWKWLNAGEARNNFYYLMPRARYGLPPLEKVTHLSQVRRGTMFQKMGSYIPLEEALAMQYLAEGVQRGPKVVNCHEGTLAENVGGEAASPGAGQSRRVKAVPHAPASRWGQDSSVIVRATQGLPSLRHALGHRRKKRSRGRMQRSASAPNHASGPQPPPHLRHLDPDGLDDSVVLDRTAAVHLRRAAARSSQGQRVPSVLQAPLPRRSRVESSLVPTGTLLLDIFSPPGSRQRRYLDLNFQRTAPVFKEVSKAKRSVVRLWNRHGHAPVHPGQVEDPLVNSSDSEADNGGVTLSDHLAWEDDLIESLELQKQQEELANEHRLRRPGLLTPNLGASRRAYARVRRAKQDLAEERARKANPTSLPTLSKAFVGAVDMVSAGGLDVATTGDVGLQRHAAIQARRRSAAPRTVMTTQASSGRSGSPRRRARTIGDVRFDLPNASSLEHRPKWLPKEGEYRPDSGQHGGPKTWRLDTPSTANGTRPHSKRAPWMRSQRASILGTTAGMQAEEPSVAHGVVAVTGQRFSAAAGAEQRHLQRLATAAGPLQL